MKNFRQFVTESPIDPQSIQEHSIILVLVKGISQSIYNRIYSSKGIPLEETINRRVERADCSPRLLPIVASDLGANRNVWISSNWSSEDIIRKDELFDRAIAHLKKMAGPYNDVHDVGVDPTILDI